MAKILITCPICFTQKERYETKRGSILYCSKVCYSIGMKTRMSGSNNPNFGNRWSDTLRIEVGNIVKQRYLERPELKEIAGTANRGKKFNEQRCKNMGLARIGKPGKAHSEESKLLIGQKSKERMNTSEMKEKIRLSNENTGRWISLEKTDSKKIYFKESNWVKRMFDILETEECKNKMKSLGVFNARTNKSGVIRDHSYCRRSGFLNGVFPEILRHPCNCQILTHSENIKKKDDRYIDRDSQSLEELFSRIETYSKDWFEQEKTLRLIELYRSGERWIDKFKEIK